MEAIVLAGGLGQRLRSVVSTVPKPMAPIAGRPFLELLIDRWIGQGVERFVLSIGYLGTRIGEHFGPHYNGAEIELVTESEPLGTGGGLLLALQHTIKDNVLVLNGDTFFAVDGRQFLAFHEACGADCTLALFRSADTVRYLSVELDRNARVIALGQRPSGSHGAANGGVYLFRRDTLRSGPWAAGQALSLETEMLPRALSSGWRLYGCEAAAQPLDIGLPHDYARAARILRDAI